MRDRRTHRGWLLAIVFIGLASTARAKPVTCDGRFDVNQGGVSLPGFGTIPTTVSLEENAVDLPGWCRLEGVKQTPMAGGGVKVAKRFRRCGPLKAGRFTARVHYQCGTLDVWMKLKKGKKRLYFFGQRHLPVSTFHTIEDRILSGRGCAVSTCHGSTRQGQLDLRPGAAFASLVGVAPDNAVARAAGKLRVQPGDVGASFLSAKLHGTLAVGEGDPMPRVGAALTDVEIALVDAWIAGGAPETGEVPGAPELPPLVYEDTPPLDPPPGGFQIVLDGPELAPGQEQEGCLWVAAPTPVDVPIRKIEIALNPGTHHFAVWAYTGSGAPPVGTWLANDVACLGSGGSFGQQIGGAPHAPYFVAEQPPGFATILPGGTYYGLNAHYYNESSAPVRIKVWVNFYPYEGTPEHLVKLIPIALDASGKINVPPYTQATVRGRLTNTSDRVMHVMGLGGHMHKRGVRFSIWKSDGTKVLDDYDWAHPSFAGFTPPYDLVPGDWIDYECLHDNGVTRPVRVAGGAPQTIVFGTSAEDEMCIVTGQHYDD
jgi:hypothetical protein